MSKVTAPEALQLTTLSGTYESARAVVRVTKIDTCTTADQLAQRLRALAQPKNREDLFELFKSLDRLSEASQTLGLTTLIRPSDHPLVTRAPAYTVKKKE